MTDLAIYRDIATRTGGDIYIGVVGPVRTGKSTLIKRFIQNMFLPSIESEYSRERAKDEMPQSASGRTVMTTEPKFVPEEAANVEIDENTSFRMKMIDCVGYIVDGAIGHIENGEPRMVMTPWSDNPLPFEQAAEMGTRKVITDHSTIALCVTTDGSIGEIPRESYIGAEKRVVGELKELNKPFVIVLNSAHPKDAGTLELARDMEDEYGVPVVALSCIDIDEDDIKNILSMIAYEFPIRELRFTLPGWVSVLESDNPLKKELDEAMSACAASIVKLGEVKEAADALHFDTESISARVNAISLGTGSARISLKLPESLFYKVLAEKSGFDISDEQSLMNVMTDLSVMKQRYDKVAEAIEQVNESGYGIVAPTIDDLTLEEPEIVKQAGGYGVRLKASGPSIHMIRANVEAQVSPIVGTERQSEELVKSLLKEFEEDPKKIWDSNMFGKSLHELVGEGLNNKLSHMPADAREKLSETLQKIINEGSGGLICILL